MVRSRRFMRPALDTMAGGTRNRNQPLAEPQRDIVLCAPSVASLRGLVEPTEWLPRQVARQPQFTVALGRSLQLPLDQASINIQLPKLMPFFRIIQDQQCAKCIQFILRSAQLLGGGRVKPPVGVLGVHQQRPLRKHWREVRELRRRYKLAECPRSALTSHGYPPTSVSFKNSRARRLSPFGCELFDLTINSFSFSTASFGGRSFLDGRFPKPIHAVLTLGDRSSQDSGREFVGKRNADSDARRAHPSARSDISPVRFRPGLMGPHFFAHTVC